MFGHSKVRSEAVVDSSLLVVLRQIGRPRRPDYSKVPVGGIRLVWELLKDLVILSCKPINFVDGYDGRAILFTKESHKTQEAAAFIATLIQEASFGQITYRKRIPFFSFLLPELFLSPGVRTFLRKYTRLRRRYEARISRDFLRYFLYYQVAYRKFSKCPPAALVIISDLGARRIALAQAANASGASVVYYQYWQHHSFEPPFKVDHAICMNNKLAVALKDSQDSVIVNRQAYDADASELTFRTAPETPVVGIATNTRIRPAGINEAITDLYMQLQPKRILFKPHPRNDDRDVREISCEISDRNADIEAFAESIDLCLVGDTTATLKILLSGTPCLYLPSLDGRGPDGFRYVRDHAVLGSETLQSVSLKEINRFYGDMDSLERIRQYLRENVLIDSDKDQSDRFREEMTARLAAH